MFGEIISIENLLEAWREFIRGKRHKIDVQEFQLHLMDYVFDLHFDLANRTYTHGGYQAFKINDPKPRDIHKASVRDRLLHHAIYRILYPFFDKKFIADSFSCRVGKGTHKALDRFRSFAYQVSKNHTRTCGVLKCDIRKFFANIDHSILQKTVMKYIADPQVLWLLDRVIDSFSSEGRSASGGLTGLPLGNLTSQLLVNIYMNEFDQYAKHRLKAKHYIRYADDFMFLSHDRQWLESLIPQISDFLEHRLKLTLHPDKLFIKTIASGVDFLGWVHFPDHRILRTATKRRIIKKISENSAASYEGLLRHGNTFQFRQEIL